MYNVLRYAGKYGSVKVTHAKGVIKVYNGRTLLVTVNTDTFRREIALRTGKMRSKDNLDVINMVLNEIAPNTKVTQESGRWYLKGKHNSYADCYFQEGIKFYEYNGSFSLMNQGKIEDRWS